LADSRSKPARSTRTTVAGRWKRRIRASSSVNHRLHDASTSRPVSGSIGGPPAAKTHGPWDSWPFDADRPARSGNHGEAGSSESPDPAVDSGGRDAANRRVAVRARRWAIRGSTIAARATATLIATARVTIVWVSIRSRLPRTDDCEGRSMSDWHLADAHDRRATGA